MNSKRLNWTYGDDYFSKETNIFEKVFQETPSKPEAPIRDTEQINLELVDYDTEYYETLRDNIILPLSGTSKVPRLISITCSDFGEGVSTIASKLALTFAKKSDKPVLLVDTNFAKPSIHKIFNLKLSPGLGEILIDKYESTGVIQPSLIHNLFIITAGDILSNPTTKFDSPMFTELLHKWKHDYSYVLFDTPPMQCDMKQCDMNSSVRLASIVDGVILVIEAERIRREIILNAKERLMNSKANILGVVLNKTKYYIPKCIYKRL